MSFFLSRPFLTVSLLLIPYIAFAKLPGPVVDGEWLLKNKNNVVIIDIQEPPLYSQHHIEGAINLPFSKWRTGDESNPPKSLPPITTLSDWLGGSGIKRTTPLVITSTGAGPGDMSASARVYWTLKVLGHEEAAILNGGLVSYVNEYGGKYTREITEPYKKATYDPKPNMELLATANWILSYEGQKLDARTLEEKVGLIAGDGERPGTLKGAKHLPYDWLVDNAGKLRPQKELKSLFDYAGLSGNGAVHFCHTGNRASLTWFVDYELFGNKDARLYDGSMIEWGKDPSLPIQRDLNL